MKHAFIIISMSRNAHQKEHFSYFFRECTSFWRGFLPLYRWRNLLMIFKTLLTLLASTRLVYGDEMYKIIQIKWMLWYSRITTCAKVRQGSGTIFIHRNEDDASHVGISIWCIYCSLCHSGKLIVYAKSKYELECYWCLAFIYCSKNYFG